MYERISLVRESQYYLDLLLKSDQSRDLPEYDSVIFGDSVPMFETQMKMIENIDLDGKRADVYYIPAQKRLYLYLKK